MEGRTSRSLSELAEEGAGEENSLLGNKEGEKVTSLDTLVPEEEVEAPLSVNQVHYNGGYASKKNLSLSLPLNPPGEPQGWSGEEEKPAKSGDKTEHLQRWGLDGLLPVALLSSFLLCSPIALLFFPSGLCHSLPFR